MSLCLETLAVEKLPHRATDPRQCTVLRVAMYIMALNVLNPTVACISVHGLLRVGVHAPLGVDISLGERSAGYVQIPLLSQHLNLSCAAS